MENNSTLLIERIVSSEDYIDNIRSNNKEFVAEILEKEILYEILNTLFPQNNNDPSNYINTPMVFTLTILQKQILHIFSSNEILITMSTDSNVIIYLENYIKKLLVASNDQVIQASYSTTNLQIPFYIIQKLCVATEGKILQYINSDSQFIDLLINIMVNLSVVDIFLFISTNYFELIHLDFQSFKKMISLSVSDYMKKQSSIRFFCVFILIQKLIKFSSVFKNIICNSTIVGTLFLIASNELFSVSISKMTLEVLANIKDCTKNSEILLIIESFKEDFDYIQSLYDPRMPFLLHLYHSRLYNLMIPFIEGKTSTFTNTEIILIVKQMNNDQFQKILNLDNFLRKFMDNFSKNRLNGHLTKFAQILMDRSSYFSQLKTHAWNRFINSSVIPRIQKCMSTYGGRPDAFFPSYADDSPPLKVQLKKILDNDHDDLNDN